MTRELTVEDFHEFWLNVEIDPKTGCWNWVGNFFSDKGDGILRPRLRTSKGADVYARRVSYFIHFHQSPTRVGCSCGNNSCVNPKHLEPVASRDATLGVMGASAQWRGEGSIPTTERLVRKVLTLDKTGMSQPKIAARLGINSGRVNGILKMAKLCKENRLKPYRANKAATTTES